MAIQNAGIRTHIKQTGKEPYNEHKRAIQHQNYIYATLLLDFMAISEDPLP